MNKKKIFIFLVMIVFIFNLTACTNKNKVEKDVIKVATSGGYYPFTYMDLHEDKLKGFDIDVWNEIGDRLGYEIEFRTISFSGIFGLLDSGKVHTISNQITVTEEREKKYIFAEPYVYTGAQIIVRNGEESIKTLKDLEGKKVGVDLGSNYEQIVRDSDPEGLIKVITYQSTDAAFNDLLLGRIDAVVIDKVSAVTAIQDKNLDLQLAGDIIEPIENSFPFVKNEKNYELVEEINQVLNDMRKDGTLRQISEKWFKTDITTK